MLTAQCNMQTRLQLCSLLFGSYIILTLFFVPSSSVSLRCLRAAECQILWSQMLFRNLDPGVEERILCDLLWTGGGSPYTGTCVGKRGAAATPVVQCLILAGCRHHAPPWSLGLHSSGLPSCLRDASYSSPLKTSWCGPPESPWGWESCSPWGGSHCRALPKASLCPDFTLSPGSTALLST